MFKKWGDLPDNMRNDGVKKYYTVLRKKRFSLCLKRLFDIVVGLFTLLVLSPLFVILSIVIKIDSRGPVMFRQTRVTQYGKQFRILKFRTMVADAEQIGTQVTTSDDPRVTKVGRFLRKFRLDEIPQLFNIIAGEMSFVGTRPEVVKYVEQYTDEMMATLLLPAGVTSEASIMYKDEERLLANAEAAEETYIKIILPQKMEYNLKSMENISFYGSIKTMFRTVWAVLKKKNEAEAYRGVVTNESNEYKTEVSI